MRIGPRLVDDAEPWDEFIARHPQGHLLQGYRWGAFKSRFGWQPVRLALEGEAGLMAGAQVLFRRSPLGTIAYLPRGPAADLEEAELAEGLFSALHQLARERGAAFLKVEPNAHGAEGLRRLGFRPSRECHQPKATLVVDLTPDLEAIAARQKPKTRYNIGLAARRGVVVTVGCPADLPAFQRLMEETGRRDGFFVRPEAYYREALEVFGEKMRLFLAYYQGKLLAGIMVAVMGPEATYLYGASSGSQRNLMPNYLLQWEAMKWAKERGCIRYDLWGIPEAAALKEGESQTKGDDPGKNLWGVYRFKAGFGGQALRYPGAFDYVYSRARYLLWERLLPIYQRWRGAAARLD